MWYQKCGHQKCPQLVVKKFFNRDSKVLLYNMQNVFLLILSKFHHFQGSADCSIGRSKAKNSPSI